MARHLRRMLAALLIVLVAVPSGVALATPYFRIDTQTDWMTALSDGRISPVNGQDFQAMIPMSPDWPSAYTDPDTMFVTPQLYVMDGPYDGEPGLVMAWGPPVPPPAVPTRIAAAWDYAYPLDPDLSGTVVEFSIFPPIPSTYFSLNLIDRAQNFREWVWHAGPGEVPAGQWSNIQINPQTGWSNWATVVPAFDGGQFDVTNIVAIRFDENIIWDPPAGTGQGWPPGPSVIFPGGQIPPGLIWNAWDHVAVTPEPATMLLLGGGLVALARRRRNRK